MVDRGQKECLRLKKRLRGEKQMGATGLGVRAGVAELCWMGEKKARPKGCSGRKRKKAVLGDGVD